MSFAKFECEKIAKVVNYDKILQTAQVHLRNAFNQHNELGNQNDNLSKELEFVKQVNENTCTELNQEKGKF